METLATERALTPWLGKVGLGIAGVLFVFGVLATTAISVSTYQFVASMPQLVAALVVVAVLVWVALGLLQPGVPRTLQQTTRRAPRRLVGAAALVATSVFKQLPRDLAAWLYVGIELILALGSVLVIWNWSRLPGWGEAQRLALAAGALFTYAWTAFPQTPILPATPTEDLLGNIIFGGGSADPGRRGGVAGSRPRTCCQSLRCGAGGLAGGGKPVRSLPSPALTPALSQR